MEGFRLKLRLRMRNNFSFEPCRCWEGCTMVPFCLPVLPPPPISLCCMVTKRKPGCSDPPFHCFDAHVYTKDVQDDVMCKLRKYDSEVSIQEQKVAIRPNSSITIGFSGTQVEAMTQATHEFPAPGAAEFQRSFPVYFKKKQECDGPITLNYFLKTPTSTLLENSIVFTWSESKRDRKGEIFTRSVTVRGKKAVGIQNNTYCECMTSKKRTSSGRNQHSTDSSCSGEDSSQPSSLSDTEGSVYYMIDESHFSYSKESKKFLHGAEEIHDVNVIADDNAKSETPAEIEDYKPVQTRKKKSLKLKTNDIITSTTPRYKAHPRNSGSKNDGLQGKIRFLKK